MCQGSSKLSSIANVVYVYGANPGPVHGSSPRNCFFIGPFPLESVPLSACGAPLAPTWPAAILKDFAMQPLVVG